MSLSNVILQTSATHHQVNVNTTECIAVYIVLSITALPTPMFDRIQPGLVRLKRILQGRLAYQTLFSMLGIWFMEEHHHCLLPGRQMEVVRRTEMVVRSCALGW
jgi:hypothetical protein